MQKTGITLFALCLFIGLSSFIRTATFADFFAGKWEITVMGTPNGDSKLVTELTRKDGKLTGELKDATGKTTEPIPITKIDEDGNKMTIYFVAQGMDINVALDKVDEDNLKGSLLGMFDATAKRIKE